MRLAGYWDKVNQSLWFIPSLLTIAAALAAYGSLEIDRHFTDSDAVRDIWFVFSVGAEGARATLSAIAQSVITVTGVVFSVTIVALQLAASQFAPRVLRTYLSDRGNQWVLGVFIGTFTYTILVQRSVGSPPDNDEAFVPSISITVAVLLMLLSIGALIYFINHIAQSIRASVIVTHVTNDARRLVDRLFPEVIGEAVEERDPQERPPLPQGTPHEVRAEEAGYLSFVDEEALFSVASTGHAVIKMEPQLGHFVIPGEILARVWFDDTGPPAAKIEKVESKIRAGFAIRDEWTLQQDLERAIVELSDIAVRALSPSLNDPTTATLCVDRLGEILARLGNRRSPSIMRSDQRGRVRFIAQRLSWERAVEVACEKIRHYGARSPAVIVRLIEVCGRTSRQVPAPRRPALYTQIREAAEAARRAIESEPDRRRIEAATRHALAGQRNVPPLDASSGAMLQSSPDSE